jgi:hypothetical protein
MPGMAATDGRITGRAFVTGLVLSAVFAYVSVYVQNRWNVAIAATQLPVLALSALLAVVLLINPFCRLVRILRPFGRVEILVMLTMGMVSAGIAGYGLSATVVPMAGNLFNPYFNKPQSGWARYVEPYLEDRFYVATAGTTAAARRYRDACGRAAAARAACEAAERAETAEAARALPGLAARLAAENAAAERDRQELRVLEQQAFARVEVFRRGLPRGLRSFPGFLPQAGDTFGAYAARARRAWYGGRAAAALRAAADEVGGGTVAPAARLDEALAALARVGSGVPEADYAAAAAARRACQDRIHETERRLDAACAEARFAAGAARSAALADSRALARELRGQRRELAAAETRWQALERGRERDAGFAQMQGELTALRGRLADGTAGAPDAARAALASVAGRLAAADATPRGFLAGHVPWRVWLRPLAWWGLAVGLTYLVLLAFNVLIFRQWAVHEKLSYPLAQIAEDLGGAGPRDADGRIPRVFRSGLFWVGVAIAGSVQGWNVLCATNLVPGLKQLGLDFDWSPFLVNTPLRGLMPQMKACIFFTLIGLAFLIPQQISFSLWFFHICSLLLLLGLVAAGRGVNADSFPTDWWYTLNFRSAIGGGALLVFSFAVLWTCRRYLLCAVRPAGLGALEPDERREIRLASAVFLGGALALWLVQWLAMGVHPLYAAAFGLVLLAMTIGLTRAVAEGGLLAFQCLSGPLHFVRTLFGMDHAATSPALFAGLMPYVSILFQDIKTFIAPAMANCLKIRHDLRLARLRFHGALLAAIAGAAVIAVGTEIAMGYQRGADNLSRWFHSNMPAALFNEVGALVRAPPSATLERGWLLFGAGAMGLLLYLRRSIFWLPHPIGLIMLVNPLMRAQWFSLLVGWACKALVTRYGNRDAYERIRPFFIGLIVGELLMVMAGAAVAMSLGIQVPVHINRQ